MPKVQQQIAAPVPTTSSSFVTEELDCVAILNLIQKGDPQALHRLYKRVAGKLYAIAFCIVRDSGCAEEVVEDVLVQVWQNPGAWDHTRGTVMAWLTVLCRSRSLDALRRLKKSTLLFFAEPTELLEEDGDIDPHEWNLALFEAPLRNGLAGLSLVERRVIELIFVAGLTHDEAAHVTGMPLGTVKSHARRGLSRLQQAFLSPAGG